MAVQLTPPKYICSPNLFILPPIILEVGALVNLAYITTGAFKFGLLFYTCLVARETTKVTCALESLAEKLLG